MFLSFPTVGNFCDSVIVSIVALFMLLLSPYTKILCVICDLTNLKFGYIFLISFGIVLLLSDILIGCRFAYLIPRHILGNVVSWSVVGKVAKLGSLIIRFLEYPPLGSSE